MLANGGRLLVGVILVWILATFGIDFLANSDPSSNKKTSLPKVNLPNISFPDFGLGNNPTNAQTTTQQLPQQTQYPPQKNFPAGYSTNSSNNSIPSNNGMSPSIPAQPNNQFARTRDKLAIGTFNIQVFGVSKIGQPEVVAILADIVQQFDVIAIQEVRSIDDRVIPYFVEVVNQNGARYAHVIGPRLGRTSSKEQYVYIYDTDRVELTSAGYIMQDSNDYIHRPPMVSHFRTRPQNGQMPFTFTLMNVHTDPDDADFEVSALAEFVTRERLSNAGEDDVILLGDLNASPDQLGDLGQIAGIAAAIPPSLPTNTRGNKNYDNLIFDRNKTVEFQASGVIDLASRYNLTLDQALQVSDHLPVWGLFSMNEQYVAPMAYQPGNLR